jgi:hypothetical protein
MLDRKPIIISIAMAATVALATICYFSYNNKPSQDVVALASKDPKSDDYILTQDGNIRSINLNNVQFGNISFDDGEIVKFWFCSHHRSSDNGTTLFRFKSEDVLMSGYFCCEVILPKSFSYDNSNNLRSFIKENNGIRP